MELAIFKDGDRYIVGPKEQGCYAMTKGFAYYCSLKEAALGLREYSKVSDEKLAGYLRTFWTDQRFEDACDDGRFGADWE